jgi:hypothetical protein
MEERNAKTSSGTGLVPVSEIGTAGSIRDLPSSVKEAHENQGLGKRLIRMAENNALRDGGRIVAMHDTRRK